MAPEVVVVVENKDTAIRVPPVAEKPGCGKSGYAATDNNQVVDRPGLFRWRRKSLAVPGKRMCDLE